MSHNEMTDGNEKVKRTRKCNGAVKNMTPEEKREYIKYYNDRRGPRNILHRHCDICNILCNSNNY